MAFRTVALLLAITLSACASDQEKRFAEGEAIYERVCASCHSTEVGPSLNGVVGRKVGSVEGFDYSEAMKKDGATWTPERIKSFVMGPLQMYPEGRMVISPLTPEEADAVVTYLENR